jgi:Flp pilus assembly protein TadG
MHARLDRQRRDTGSALVELAICLPVLVLVMIGTIDFARVFYTSISLSNAARAGAQYGAYNLAQSGDTATMQTTATGATNLTGVTAAASRSCQCATDLGVFSYTSPTLNDCTSPETTSCGVNHLVVTVTVTASKTFTTIMSHFPGIPNSLSLSRAATMRISR